MKTAYFESPELEERAFQLLRGNASYQFDLLEGRARWSGSDLKGKARTYGASYAESRKNLLDRLEAHSIHSWIGRVPSVDQRTHIALFWGD